MKSIFIYNTGIGRIGIAEKDEKITNVFFETDLSGIYLPTYNLSAGQASPGSDSGISGGEGYTVRETVLLKEAFRQLEDYLTGRIKTFTLPLAPEGTDFMKNVWQCLCRIPYGQTKSYRDIAEAAGNPKASRAVGAANHRNPIPVFIPCHRVIGSNGKLTGYRGGLETKQRLLEIEKNYADI